MDFYQLHELFDEMASELEEYVDMVAEQVTALSGLDIGTARVAASSSELPEYPFDILEGKDHVTALADRYAPYAQSLRANIDTTGDLGEADTADPYTEISRASNKRLWFLEAHLQTAFKRVAVTETSSKTESRATPKAATKATAAQNNSKGKESQDQVMFCL